MKRFLLRNLPLAAFCLLTFFTNASAQRAGGGQRMERLETARIAYITDKISLTPDQAQRFWPLFNEFTDKRKELRRQTKMDLRRQDFSTMSEKDIRAAIDDQFKLRQGEINLEKEYVDKFQKVITLRQVAQLMQAERDFTKALIQRLDNGRASGPARGQD